MRKRGPSENKGQPKTGAIDSFISQVPAKYQSKQAQTVERKVQESGRCVWPEMSTTENWGCQEMRHLIGLLMAVFQVFATLYILGRRKKELETWELYLSDDRVIIVMCEIEVLFNAHEISQRYRDVSIMNSAYGFKFSFTHCTHPMNSLVKAPQKHRCHNENNVLLLERILPCRDFA